MSGAQAGVLGAIAILVLTIIVRRLLPGGTRTFELLQRLRRAREAAREIGLADAYHRALEADVETERPEATDRNSTFDQPASVDDRTWTDLDLDDVFLKIDRTVSQVGRQYLYRLLRTPSDDRAVLERRDAAATRLAEDPSLAERIRKALVPLADYRSGQLVNLMFGDLPRRPAFAWIFVVLTVSSIALIAAVPFWPRAFIAWVAVCVTNIVVQVAYKPRLRRFIAAIHEVPKFVHAATRLGAISIPELAFATHELSPNAHRLRTLKRATGWLMFEPDETNELMASVYEYVNMILLLDVNAFMLVVGALETLRPVMRATFEALGKLDALQATAAWRAELDRWSRPRFIEQGKRLAADQVYHPLLASPVANSIEIRGRGVLITGSNMSGKTTFVRTLGVNAVLAQTLFTVCADLWQAPMLIVRSSIGRSDSILEGRSYYLAEVEAVRSLIVSKQDGRRHLFLLDEIFRGTNTPERVAAGYAVLRYLNRGDDIVVIATHDVELVGLLGDTYDVHHFREEIGNGAITFDHRIRSGPSSTTNAIALLGLLGYPAELVADARSQLGR
jgi:DNA mismatch repair ATPase MutS